MKTLTYWTCYILTYLVPARWYPLFCPRSRVNALICARLRSILTSYIFEPHSPELIRHIEESSTRLLQQDFARQFSLIRTECQVVESNFIITLTVKYPTEEIAMIRFSIDY